MQVRRPDGGIVPSTASRRFTSDAQVSSSKPLAHPGSLDGVAVLFPGSVVQGCQASSRLLMYVHRLGTRIATQATAGAKKHPANNAHTTVVAISQPCGILTAPPSSVAVRRRSHPLHPGPINAGEGPELRRDGCPPPLDRERDLACFKLVVTHLSSRQVVSRRWTSSEVWPYRLTDCTAI